MALDILFPNGHVLASLMYIDAGAGPVIWDGNVSVVIGPGTTVTADQGAAGLDPWLVDAAIATNLAPSYSEGDRVALSLTLDGKLRTDTTVSTAGLATEAKQDDEITLLTSIDGKLTSPLTVQATDLDIRNLVFATDKVDVSGSSGVGVTGTFFQATQPVSAVDLDIRNLVFATDKVDVSGSAITATVDTSLLATSAKQDTGNASLASIKTDVDTLVTSGGGGYIRQDSTGTIAKETGGNLATVKTNTDGLAASGGGGYIRQDSTATIAKESGGNLASLVTQTTVWTVFNATSSDGATALTNSAQAIKGSAGQVGGWYIYNPNTAAAFVQLYNTAAASVTVGTTNPLFMLTIPALSAANLSITNGTTFGTAISAAATSTAGGNGALTTALDAVFFYR